MSAVSSLAPYVCVCVCVCVHIDSDQHFKRIDERVVVFSAFAGGSRLPIADEARRVSQQ
jgi:hypothetical protein